MKKIISGMAAAIVSIVLITACGKTGPAGATGPAGVAGPGGPQGIIGNANVYTDTFTLVSADWIWNSTYYFTGNNGLSNGYFSRYHDVMFAKITQGMIDSGMVMVFLTPDQLVPTAFSPLPYSFISFSDQYYYNFEYEATVGKVRLHYFYTPNGAAGTLPTTLSTDQIATHKFKIIVVGGTVSTAMQQSQIDVNDYDQVKKFLDLP